MFGAAAAARGRPGWFYRVGRVGGLVCGGLIRRVVHVDGSSSSAMPPDRGAAVAGVLCNCRLPLHTAPYRLMEHPGALCPRMGDPGAAALTHG